MRRLPLALVFLIIVGVAPAIAAQQGPPGPSRTAGPGPGVAALGAPGVEMLLAQTGALQLTDAQVVRLAAIARRSDERRRVLRTHLDSLRPRRTPGDSAARRDRVMPPTDLFQRERDASHADLRDALAVLTPEQQARAWEMVAARGIGGPGFGARGMAFPRPGMMRDGRGGRDGGRDDGGRDGARRPPRPGSSNSEQR